MSFYWRAWCENENTWVYEWSDNEITQCPNNGSHNLRSGSISTLRKKKLLAILSVNENVEVSSYQLVKTFVFPGSKIAGKIHSIKVSSYKESEVDSYDIKIRDKTNGKNIAEKKNMNNEKPSLHDLGSISNIPDSESEIQIQVKTYGNGNGKGNSKKKGNAIVDSLNIYVDEDE